MTDFVGERIAVEYLLAQSGRGDLLGQQQDSELGVVLPEMQVDVQEEDSPDVTISDITDIVLESPPRVLQHDQLEMSAPNTPFLQEDSSSMSSQVMSSFH